jgi:hypothetical protein
MITLVFRLQTGIFPIRLPNGGGVPGKLLKIKNLHAKQEKMAKPMAHGLLFRWCPKILNKIVR